MSDDELLERFKEIDKRWAKLEEDAEDRLLDSFINADFGEDENEDEQE
ncbi:MAG: hypothetical protein ACLFMM_07395 [Methanohalobium sp.]